MAERTRQQEGFSVVVPLKEKRALIVRSQKASEQQDKQRAAAAKVPNYSVPRKGARLGGASDETSARRSQAVTQRKSLHKLRRGDPPASTTLPEATVGGGGARPSPEALRAARLAKLDGAAEKLPKIGAPR